MVWLGQQFEMDTIFFQQFEDSVSLCSGFVVTLENYVFHTTIIPYKSTILPPAIFKIFPFT